MKVLNIHERELSATYEQVGALIDSLSSQEDCLWPNHSWPCMKFDRPLGIEADGGHGPIGFFVERPSKINPSPFLLFRRHNIKRIGWDKSRNEYY